MGPNALVLNKTQEQSKMSQSVHVEIKKIGQTGVDRQRANRAIGEMSTSGISTYSQQNPRRNRQGGVVDCGDWFREPSVIVSDACVVPSVSVSKLHNCSLRD